MAEEVLDEHPQPVAGQLAVRSLPTPVGFGGSRVISVGDHAHARLGHGLEFFQRVGAAGVHPPGRRAHLCDHPDPGCHGGALHKDGGPMVSHDGRIFPGPGRHGAMAGTGRRVADPGPGGLADGDGAGFRGIVCTGSIGLPGPGPDQKEAFPGLIPQVFAIRYTPFAFRTRGLWSFRPSIHNLITSSPSPIWAGGLMWAGEGKKVNGQGQGGDLSLNRVDRFRG